MLSLQAPGVYNLRHTMSGSRMGAYDPSMRVGDGSLEMALHTPEGPASLRVSQREHVLQVESWGEGATWLEPHFPALLGLTDRASAFDPSSGAVRKLWKRFSGMHLPSFPVVLRRIVQVTLLQLVTWQDACRSWRRLVNELGEAAPGPLELRLPPTRQRLASTPDYALVALGIRPKQARTLQRVAKYASRLEEAARSGADALARRLAAIRGIGPWTIAYVQGSGLAFPDAVLLGDYDLPHTVAYILAGEARASEERMLELLEPYRGHRFRVIRLIWMNGVSAPRRGPRVS